jgi:hypothetical protein
VVIPVSFMEDPQLGLHTLSGGFGKTTAGPEASFSGVALQAPVDRDAFLARAQAALLEERDSPAFEFIPLPFRNGVPRMAIRSVQGLDADEAAWWWVAEGSDDAFLDSGPLSPTPALDEPGRWIASVVAVPEGTVAVWFGVAGAEDEQGARRMELKSAE